MSLTSLKQLVVSGGVYRVTFVNNCAVLKILVTELFVPNEVIRSMEERNVLEPGDTDRQAKIILQGVGRVACAVG